MADWNNNSNAGQRLGSVPRAGGDIAGRAVYDEGLRSYMLSIYNYMASAVLLTGIVAMVAASSGLTLALAGSPLMWVVALAPLGLAAALLCPPALRQLP